MVIDLHELYVEYIQSCQLQIKQENYGPFISDSKSFWNYISPFINRENSSSSTDISANIDVRTKKSETPFQKAVSDEPKLYKKLNLDKNLTFNCMNVEKVPENSSQIQFVKPKSLQNNTKTKSLYFRQMTRSKKNKESKKFDFNGF